MFEFLDRPQIGSPRPYLRDGLPVILFQVFGVYGHWIAWHIETCDAFTGRPVAIGIDPEQKVFTLILSHSARSTELYYLSYYSTSNIRMSITFVPVGPVVISPPSRLKNR